MRKAYVFLLAATLLSGCAFSYRQPVFQGNLLDKEYVDQIKPGMPAVGSSSRIVRAPPTIVMPISSARCSA